MRFLVVLLTILLFLNILGFVLTNLETRVAVNVWRSAFPDVPLFAVVILSVLVGIVFAGVIAVAEGANLRLANHRLSREVQKLETELNYLRTQPPVRPRAEPDLVTGGDVEPAPERGESRKTAASPASAPVYGGNDGTWEEPASGDDPYSGGRAV